MHIPRYALRYKIKHYINLYEDHDDSAWYSDLDDSFPSVLLILPNEQKLRFVKRFLTEQLQGVYDDERPIFLLTTTKHALTYGLSKSEIWEEVRIL